jgi:6-phosphogluconolactonase/glucosamine-6-phosphate isomerase/deaminase
VAERAEVALSGEFNGFVRMTLTPPVVNGARHRLVLAPGASKAPALAQWMLRDPSLPVQRVRRTATVVVVDTAAAAQLPAAR